MPWSKLDDNIFEHPKMLRAGEDAANLYVRGLVYCNRFLTDGRIEAEVLPAITRKREAPRLAADLVRVGLWETHPDGGWLVHDFHEHNPTAEEVAEKRAALAAKRSEAGKRGGMRSGETRSNEAKRKQGASSVSKQTEANAEQTQPEATKQNASPIPSPSYGETTSLLSDAPPAPPTGNDGAKAAPREEKPTKAKRPKADNGPMPFKVDDAIAAIAAAAPRRFVVGERAKWDGGWVIGLNKLVRRFPDLSTWSLVGAWLEAGFGGGPPSATFSVRWAAGSSFTDAVGKAQAWDASGRPPVVAGRSGDLFAAPRRVGPAPVSSAEDFERSALAPDPLIEIARRR